MTKIFPKNMSKKSFKNDPAWDFKKPTAMVKCPKCGFLVSFLPYLKLHFENTQKVGFKAEF